MNMLDSMRKFIHPLLHLFRNLKLLKRHNKLAATKLREFISKVFLIEKALLRIL